MVSGPTGRNCKVHTLRACSVKVVLQAIVVTEFRAVVVSVLCGRSCFVCVALVFARFELAGFEDDDESERGCKPARLRTLSKPSY